MANPRQLRVQMLRGLGWGLAIVSTLERSRDYERTYHRHRQLRSDPHHDNPESGEPLGSQVVCAIASATSTGCSRGAARQRSACRIAIVPNVGTKASSLSCRKVGATARRCHFQSAPSAMNNEVGPSIGHARDAHLPATAEVREGRRHSRHPGHRGSRLQVSALTPKLAADALAPA